MKTPAQLQRQISRLKPLAASAALVLFGTLTGCQSLPKNQTAHDAMQQSLAQSLEETSYNFRFEQKFKLNAKDVVLENKKTAGKTPLTAATKTYDDCDAAYDESLRVTPAEIIAKGAEALEAQEAYLAQQEDEYASCLDEVDAAKVGAGANFGADLGSALGVKDKMTHERIDAINAYLLDPFTIIMDGAYDAKARQMQLNYELSYQPKNFTLQAKLPMLFDLNDLSVTLDPAVALPILGTVFSEKVGTKWQDKSVKLHVPKEIAEQIPTEIITSSLAKAMISAYGKIDPSEFSFAQKDAFAKQVGAARVIDMKMSPKTQVALLDNLIIEFINQVKIESEAHPEKIKDLKSFNEFLSMAEAMAGKGVFGKDGILGEGAAGNDTDITTLMSPADAKLYLNSRGNMVGFSMVQNMSMLADIINADVVTTATGTVTNYGRAKFSYRPKASDIIDGNALIKKYMDERSKKKAERAAADAPTPKDKALEVYDETFDTCMSKQNDGDGLSDDDYTKLENDCYDQADAAFYAALPPEEEAYERAYDKCLDDAGYNDENKDFTDDVLDTLEKKCEAEGDAAYKKLAPAASAVAEGAANAAVDDGQAIEQDNAISDFCEKEARYKNSAMCKNH